MNSLTMSLIRILFGRGEFLALRLSEPILNPKQKPSANHISPEHGHTLRILNSSRQDSTNHGSKCVKMKVSVAQPCPTLCDLMDCSPLGSSVHGILQVGRWSGSPCPAPGNLPNPGFEFGPPALQVDSLLSEPLGEPLHGSKLACNMKSDLEEYVPSLRYDPYE